MASVNKIYTSMPSLFTAFVLPIGKLLQVEELALNPTEEMRPHGQRCQELTYVISGKAQCFCDGESVELNAGDIHFVNKCNIHSITPISSDVFRFICVGINLNKNHKIISSLWDTLTKNNHFTIRDSGDIRILLELLLNEFYIEKHQHETVVTFYVLQIFTLLNRLVLSSDDSYDESGVRGKTNYTIYNILRYIDREYMNISTVKTIANKFSYSESYISHMFKEKMGVSVKQYLCQKKIAKAQYLLKTTDNSIEKISEYLNFNSTHSF